MAACVILWGRSVAVFFEVEVGWCYGEAIECKLSAARLSLNICMAELEEDD